MGISEGATFDYWDDFELPGSDDIRAEVLVVKQVHAETVSVVEPKGKKEVLKEESVYFNYFTI
jgi:hypothetical protein